MSTDSTSDLNHPILNLSAEEKRIFAYLFAQADKDQLGVVTGENAVIFFERTKVSPNVLGEIWQIADTENRGLLTRPGFCMVLRLIGHYQAGREPSAELAFKPGPIPKFEGLQIPASTGTAQARGSTAQSPTAPSFPVSPIQAQTSGQGMIRVPPLDPQKVQQYSGLFERSGAQNGLLDGGTAKTIFERAGLPNEALGRIWNLSDREQRGALDQTEFIVAMHLLTSMKSRTMTALPNVLPLGLYEAAARRGAPPPSRQGTGLGAIPRQLTGGSVGAIPRTQSPLARPQGLGTPPHQAIPWLITPADKAKFDQFFNNLDTQGLGLISGEQAVSFFSDSRLPEDTLAQIWDLADINSAGQLNKDEFAVAMYLIRQQRAPNPPPLPAFLPPQLVPPSMRKQTQQTQSTAPAFDNANNTSTLSKSAADDLFGLDEPSPPRANAQQAPLQPQVTGASATRDPFATSQPGSPSSPARFNAQPQQASTMFKPFMPTSAFGASLASQNTGGSVGSSQAGRTLPLQQPSAMDDLLGDNDTHVEENNKITNETTELANMSSQIGNLRNQMEQTQAKKSTTQAAVSAAAAHKKDLEIRLQQFRAQYEQEVRTVKDLEQQLDTSRESTQKLGQELAMIEGTFQDLQTQRQTVAQALQADQQENSGLKQRITQLNAEVARLKPELEKLRMDARQQKGMVSINKKQLATNEDEKNKLQGEKSDLERQAAEREEQSRSVPFAATSEQPTSPAPPSNLASPASTLSSTNPFFRKASGEGIASRALSPAPTTAPSGPTPSAFDAIFGPSAAQAGSRSGTPPATSFAGKTLPAASVPAGMSDSMQSVSSVGELTPSATPPPTDGAKDDPSLTEPPPPPVAGQFTSSHLPVSDVDKPRDVDLDSTRALPPASRAGPSETLRDTFSDTGDTAPHIPGSFDDDERPEPVATPAAPGSFPADFWQTSSAAREPSPAAAQSETHKAAKDEFDSAFADFGDDATSKDAGGQHEDPFSSFATGQSQTRGFTSEFPPIESLEPEDEDSDDDSSVAFDDNFAAASPKVKPVADSLSQAKTATPVAAGTLETFAQSATAPPAAHEHASPPAYEDSKQLSHGGPGDAGEASAFPAEFTGLLPSREDPTSPPPAAVAPPAAGAAKETVDELPTVEAQTPLANDQHLYSSVAGSTEAFHDASSRPLSNATDAASEITTVPAQQTAPKSAFDEFDDFEDLAPAQDHGGSDFDFGFSDRNADEFSSAFDSPAASMSTTMASSQQTPIATRSVHPPESSGFEDFGASAPTLSAFDSGSGSGSIQQTPQSGQHDWDAIFSGLDSSQGVDTSFPNDPWGETNGSTGAGASTNTPAATFPTPATAAKTIQRGGAITPGTEHDDPILKRLTGMGYPRADALTALEKYDYDINRAVDHLAGN